MHDVTLQDKQVEDPVDNSQISDMLNDFNQVFDGSLGTIKGHEAKIYNNDAVMPRRCRPKNAAIALQDQVSSELAR